MRLQTRLLGPVSLAPAPRRVVGPVVALVGIGALALLVARAPGATAQESELEAYGDLVVGTWEADDSRHDFAWGVGSQVVKSTGYALDGAEWVIVSEGWWYWDPSEQTIRGQTVAVGMGIDLFEHRTRVEGDRIVHDLIAHGEMGGTFVERWTFDGEGYTWSLEQNGARLMGGAYRRTR